MQQGDDLPIRAQYDVSMAKPSRHAQRLSDDERQELIERAAIQDAQTWLAFALHQVQNLEATIVSYVALAWEESTEAAGSATAAIMESGNEPVRSQVLTDIRDHGVTTTNFDILFAKVIAERNWLVHKGGLYLENGLDNPEEMALFVARLERLVKDARDIRKDVAGSLEQRLSLRGLSTREIKRRADEVVQRWLAA